MSLDIVKEYHQEMKLCNICYETFTRNRLHKKPVCSKCQREAPRIDYFKLDEEGNYILNNRGEIKVFKRPMNRAEFERYEAGFKRSERYL